MTFSSVTLDCPAKVNLALSVGQRDDATGLHPLSSWMVAADLCDTLTVSRLEPHAPTEFSIGFAPDAPQNKTVDWPHEHDLAVRAHAAVEAASNRSLPVALSLQKRIPPGGGLGGGSSDAAGVLVALDRLFGSPLQPDALHTVAYGLGSDVPFALAALTQTPSAVVSGTGESIHAAPTPGGHLVLVIPPFGCNTAEVFAHFDRAACPKGPLAPSVLVAQARLGKPQNFFNDLAEPAVAGHPRLGGVLDAVAKQSGRQAHVTGSGSTCFIAADNADEAQAVAASLAAEAARTAASALQGCAVRAVQYPCTTDAAP